MSFGIYIIGYLTLMTGLAIAANMLHVPGKWIGVGVICMIGIAILHGVSVTRQRTRPPRWMVKKPQRHKDTKEHKDLNSWNH